MDEMPDLSKSNVDPGQPATDEEILRRLIRLVVGITLIGQDALRNQLPLWEAEAARALEAREQQKHNAPAGETEETTKPPEAPWFPKSWEYRLIGLAFETPNYIKSGLRRMHQAPQAVWRKTAPLRLPLDVLGVTGFANHWVEGFLERLKVDGEQWEKIGEMEAQTSRALGQAAVIDILNLVLEYLSENEEVQDLIKSQTSSMTDEVIGEVRQRAVSTDTFIEAIIRRVLRQPFKPPGEMQLPPPAEERKSSW